MSNETTGRTDGTVYEIGGNDADGWHWRVSRPGRPGEQSDTFATRDECEADVLREYPGARYVQTRWW